MKEIKFSELSHFTDKQKQANEMMKRFKFLLYGGAMGGGKSYWLRWECLKFLLYWAGKGMRNVRVGLFCEDYPALQDRHLSKVDFEFPEWIGTLNKAEHEFVLKKEYGSGVICFRNLDNPAKYQSSEFAMIAVDEITKNEREVFDFLRTRLRWPGIEDVKFIAATNPGDIGHTWVRRMFIDKDFDDEEKERDQFGFIQALADDNPYLSSSYLKTLDSLPIDMQKAYRRGDWDVFKGQFFGEWRKTKNNQPYHVIPSFELLQSDQVFGSMDWGFSPDSFAYHLHAVRKISLPHASFIRTFTFAELYGNNKFPQKWAKLILDMEKELKDQKIYCRYADPSAGNKHPVATEKEGSGTSVLEEFANNGVVFLPANNDRAQGYQAQRNWLSEAPDGFPYWQIAQNCEQLIKQIPSAIYDPNNSFLTKEGGEDHAREGTRYFIVSRPFNNIKLPVKIVKDEMSMENIKRNFAYDQGIRHRKRVKEYANFK